MEKKHILALFISLMLPALLIMPQNADSSYCYENISACSLGASDPMFKDYSWSMDISICNPEDIGYEGAVYRPYPGAYLGLRAWLSNTGSSRLYIYGVEFEFSDVPSYRWKSDFEEEIYVDPEETVAIGSIFGESEDFGLGDMTLFFWVPNNIPPGVYNIRVGVYQKHLEWYGWVDDGLVWGPWESILVYNPPKIVVVSAYLDQTEVIKGDSVTLTITLRNIGDCFVEDSKLMIYVDYNSIQDSPKYVGSFNPDDQKTITVYISEPDYRTTGEHTIRIVVEMKPALSDSDEFVKCDEYTLGFTVKSNNYINIGEVVLIAILGTIVLFAIYIKKRKSKF